MNERSLLQPLFLLILGVDQLLKGAAVLLLPVGGRVQLLPGLDYVLLQSVGGIASPERLRLAVIVLMSAWLLLRLQQRSKQAAGTPGPPVLLLAGGIASNLVDLVLLRQRIGLFQLHFPHGELLLSVADAAIATGALLMVLDLARSARSGHWTPPNLRPPVRAQVDLTALPRGIDNVRVDVHLSPAIRRLVQEIATAALTPHIWLEAWRATPYGPNPASLDVLRRSYRELVETAAHRAQGERKPVLVALAQLALVACIRRETTLVFDRLAQEFRREVERQPPSAARSAARQQQHLALIRKRRHELIEETRELLLQQVQRSETGALRDLRHALAGAGAGLPSELLANPMLCAPDPDDERFLLRHYLLVGHRADDATHPRRIERVLRECLGCSAELETDPRSGESDTAVESGRQLEPCPWLDVGENLDLLLDLDGTLEERARARRRGERARSLELDARAREQRRLLETLEQRLRAEGLLSAALAGEQIATLWKQLALPVSPRLLQRYLANRDERRSLADKLRRLERSSGGDGPILESLERALQRIRQMDAPARRRAVGRFVRTFFAYVRDRKRLRAMHEWMEQIHLLDQPDALRLARSNRILHEFLIPDDTRGAAEAAIAGHVVIKADVRGSMAMTAELLERKLNPATHFSVNFFEPIGALIDLYGAQKVFIEGDAVILALLEEAGDTGARLSVARACGLARSILEVVASHNLTAAGSGLPPLELGLGIAYEPGPPAWLYDDDRPIMISPAIGRADRLSSCAAFLRSEPEFAAGNRVQVFQAVARSSVDDKKGAARFRYNVDGVELEADAFRQLAREIQLEVDVAADANGGARRLHRGRYPDAGGVLRNLVVREGRIWSFDRRKGPMHETSEPFFEVVGDAGG